MKPMRWSAPMLLLAVSSSAVLVLAVVAWRPWADGAQDRLVASGLTTLLALVVGQAGTLAASAIAGDRALMQRRDELNHERALRDREVQTAREEAKRASDRAEQERHQGLIADAAQNLATLADAAGAVGAYRQPSVPEKLAADTTVSLMRLRAMAAADPTRWEDLDESLLSVLYGLSDLQKAVGDNAVNQAAKDLFEATQGLIRQIMDDQLLL